MQNADDCASWHAKHESHRRINAVLWQWLEAFFLTGGRVLTLPCHSGKQENEILDKLQELEAAHSTKSKIKLITVDNKLRKEATNVRLATPAHLWEHYIADVFSVLCNLPQDNLPTAAWLDLTGGLTEYNRLGIERVVNWSFPHGSLLFVTLQVHGCRQPGQLLTKLHKGCKTPEGRLKLDGKLLEHTIRAKGKRYLMPCFLDDGPFLYTNKRGNTRYGVYGYLVGETKITTTS